MLLVDFVNPLSFDGAQALAPSALAAARQTNRLRRRLAAEGARTIYANDNYGQWTSDFKALWRHCLATPGNAGKLAKLVTPRRDDFALLKPRHSAFYATPLDLLLEQLRCKRLVVTGIAADSCVFFSAMDAYLRGYSVSVPIDCVAAESAVARDNALEQMARVLKADIRPSEAVR
ncbi:nicotinamidase-related amidase [Pelomonas saccharophila]|uniref:Nicotinamidase-related amidase n=1 Tax=Roseateles saccharophilus TaxID=304 RepID=A0ABU1YKI2_ROSSA|nr:isochorismatase family cysteine hydrolase [Roseateles saccharophilus]MDR7269362.1 nicotinamidase-related amidase [Roseateles saccharophilus]